MFGLFLLSLNKPTAATSRVYPLQNMSVPQPSLPSACLAPVRTSTKGLPFQLAMALCDAPHDTSAFSAQPRLCSRFIMLEGFSSLASPGHARMHIDTCLPDSNRHESFVHLLLQGISAVGHGLALTAAEFLVFAFVSLVELTLNLNSCPGFRDLGLGFTPG